MDDSISRQAATSIPILPKEHRDYISFELDDIYEQGWNECQKIIAELPSAQTEIVRCKECKQAPKGLSGVLFNFHCPIINQIVCADDYCFMGRKREESDDVR